MNSGYIHVEPQLGDYQHGDGKLGTVPLVVGGQWDAFLPETHQQDENGFEPEDCVSEATINAVETLEIQEYGTNRGWARRVLATASGTADKHGNDAQTVSETLRTAGVPYEADYPFKAPDWATFYQTLTQSIKTLSIAKFAEFSYGHSWVNANHTDMMAALEYSPLTAAGYAWSLNSETGLYETPPGTMACHDFMVYGYEPNQYWKVRDSYAPFDKKLAWDYQFTAVKRHTLHRNVGNTSQAQSAWVTFLNWITTILQQTFKYGEYGAERLGGATRSPEWPRVRAAHLLKEPACQVCGGTTKLNVHHVRPFHLHPELELDDNNLITLCTGSSNTLNCHVRFGHWDNFRTKYNPQIRLEAPKWKARFDAKVEDESL
jgi:5-methylcytosine-specific restriction protein A